MIDKQLESLRKEYLKIGPSVYLSSHGWPDLVAKLDSKQSFNWKPIFGRGLAFAAVIAVFFGGVVGAAQAAKPGDPLYPVKLTADNIAAQVLRKPEIKVERRGQDVIDVTNDSQKQLDEAAKEYQNSLEESKKDIQPSNRQNFVDTLEDQEEKFKKAQDQNPQSKNKLEEVINETQQVRGEVQGARDQLPAQGNRSNNSQNSNSGQNHGQGQNPSSNHNHK